MLNRWALLAGIADSELSAELTNAGLPDLLSKIHLIFPSSSAGHAAYQAYAQWLQPIAVRGDDVRLSQCLITLLETQHAAATPVPPLPRADSLLAHEVEARLEQVCIDIARATMVAEAWIKTGCTQPDNFKTSSLASLLRECTRLVAAPNLKQCSSDLLQSLVHTVEKTRFYSSRAVRSGKLAIEHEASLCDILQQLADIAQILSTCPALSNDFTLISGAIEGLMLLTQRIFKAESSSSYPTTLSRLQTAKTLLNMLAGQSAYVQIARSLASVSAFPGMLLYNAGRHANAIAFLSMACEVSRKALDPGQDLGVHGKEMADALPKRIETLGLCQHHTGEKQEAAKLYRESLQRVILGCTEGKTAEEQEMALANLSNDKNFQRANSRYTKLVLVDLLKPPAECCILSTEAGFSCFAQASVLEGQIRSLDDHWSRPEVLAAVREWLGVVEVMYRSANAPARLCRTLLRQMELSATTTGFLSMEGLNAKAAIVTDLANNAEEPAAVAFSKIWLAFDAVRRKDPKASKILGKEAKEALRLLIDDYHASIASWKEASPPRPIVSKGASASLAIKATSASRAPSTRTTKRTLVSAAVASKQTDTKPSLTAIARKPLSPKNAIQLTVGIRNVTPQRKAVSRSPPAVAVKAGTSGSLKGREIDPWKTASRSHTTLAALASILGAFGHTFLRISCLKLLRALHEAASVDGEGRVLATVSDNLADSLRRIHCYVCRTGA